jgi:hypothetical protein
MSEEWRDIPGYDGYQAGTLGNIRIRDTGKIITNSAVGTSRYKREKRNTDGRIIEQYKFVSLHVNGKSVRKLVHRLIALAFLGEPSIYKSIVNHKNGVKRDNRLENLEYVTYSENTQHYHDTIKRRLIVLELSIDEYIDLENRARAADMQIEKYIRSLLAAKSQEAQEKESLSPSEYEDLQAILKDGGYKNISEYVRSLIWTA